MIVTAVILYVVAALLFICGIKSLLQKGYLFNNAYIYATKQERETMNKKPYYIQTGLVFILIGTVFVLEGFSALFKDLLYFYVSLGVITLTLIFAIVSTIYIEKK